MIKHVWKIFSFVIGLTKRRKSFIEYFEEKNSIRFVDENNLFETYFNVKHDQQLKKKKKTKDKEIQSNWDNKMESKLDKQRNVQLTDWQIFTNNGNFNNPLPPNRRLRKNSPYFLIQIDSSYIIDQCRSVRSRRKNSFFIWEQKSIRLFWLRSISCE